VIPAALTRPIRTTGKLRLILLVALGLFTAGAARPAQAQITVQMVSDSLLTLDSNKPSGSGPNAAYVQFRVTNTSGSTQLGVFVTLSGFANGITLAGGQSAQQYLGALAPGESRDIYWFMEYPRVHYRVAGLTATVTTNSGLTASATRNVRTYPMISAGTGGALVTQSLSGQGALGATVFMDVQYSFGQGDLGDTYNLQPAGNTVFDARCFQLVGTEVLASAIPAIPAGARNQQYFKHTSSISQGGNNNLVTMRFAYRLRCVGTSTTAQPYASQLSGTQLKYSGNYETDGTGGIVVTFPSGVNAFTVSKRSSPAQLVAGGTVTYTITVRNTGSSAAFVDSIVDVLPGGVTYTGLSATSGINTINSSDYPNAGASGTIKFRGYPGSSYTINAGDSLRLIYTVSVPSTPGQYINTANAYAGLAVAGTATSPVTVGQADVSLGKTGPTTVATGDTIVYVLTTANAGPTLALNVVVRDTLPAGVTFISATRGATASAGVVTWPAMTLASGASRVDSVRVSAPASIGTLLNRGSSTSDTYDPAAGNNDGSAPGSQVSTTVVAPIDVTPDGGIIPRLQNGAYSQMFTVNHVGGTTRAYDLIARASGATVFLAIDSIRGTGITTQTRLDSARVTLTARTSYSYTVFYRVAAGDTLLNRESLTARAAAAPTVLDSGWVSIRRVLPRMTLTKSVTPTGVLTSGSELTYTMQSSNVGEWAARNVAVTDSVPIEVQFKLASTGQTLPAGVTAAVSYSNDAGVTWSYTPVSGGCGAPPGFDACVRRIRWLLGSDLPSGSGASSSTFSFIARIR
jgi:uncharacterized repeat protein (TIGR01451 family)